MIIENPKINPYNYNNLFLTKIFLKCTGEKKQPFPQMAMAKLDTYLQKNEIITLSHHEQNKFKLDQRP